MSSKAIPLGAGFLIHPTGSEKIFSPEQFNEDQRMFADTARRFVEEAVLPNVEALEHPDEGYTGMVAALKQAGQLGLLMVEVPEEYGGLGLDKTTAMLCAERIAVYAGFSVSFGAHTGIGTQPITFFGTPEQKAKWLPDLASGEKLAAYALTEPGSGSDALAARTTAMLTADGEHYVLNGSKMWITNAGFADVFVVFAQVDGDKFTAFIVEADRPGFSRGTEEHKLGLKGSSTRLITLEDVKVPKGNLLGEVGKGHKIAFNILNIGRFKLGVGCLGGSKSAIKVAIDYASERRQFGKPIVTFGAIREKIGEMAVGCYALESMCYRVAGYMDASIEAIDPGVADYPAQVMKAIEEYAVEDSIIKIVGSELFWKVADHTVQIFGGFGYSEEYPAARLLRDARINMIFEGTNEINRMLIPGTILKRTMKGQLPLFAAIAAVTDAIASPKPEVPPADDELHRIVFLSEKAKQLTVYTANQAIQKHMADLKEQQELLLALADMMIACYAIDSTVTRTIQLDPQSRNIALKRAAARTFVGQTYPTVLALAEQVLEHIAGGKDKKRVEFHAALDKLGHRSGLDVIGGLRTVADATIEAGRYPF